MWGPFGDEIGWFQLDVKKRLNRSIAIAVDKVGAAKRGGEFLIHEGDPIAIPFVAPGANLPEHLFLGSHPAVVVEHGSSVGAADVAPFGAGEKVVDGVPLVLVEEDVSLKGPFLGQHNRVFKPESLIRRFAKVPIIGELEGCVVPIVTTVEPLGKAFAVRDLVCVEEEDRFDLFAQSGKADPPR